MKETRKSLLVAALLMALCLLLSLSAALADGGSYEYGAARSMLDMVNAFRTGSDAWYWESDDVTKTYATGLRALTYDYDLEKTAMLRASELATKFSHTRPDGSKWSTAFPSGNFYKGENIAYGYTSAESAFTAFMESDEDYAGQGHRRNMLRSEFTRVGFGAVKIGNTIYWAQAFASGSGGSAEAAAPAGGWQQQNGTYYYVLSDGGRATGWLQDGGEWYYMDSKGAMKTGWLEIDGAWYYFKSSGAMATGWININGQNEYFDNNGVWQYSEPPATTETIEDYDTPLATGSSFELLIGAILQFLFSLIP